MKCTSCGHEVTAQDKFCSFCGMPVKAYFDRQSTPLQQGQTARPSEPARPAASDAARQGFQSASDAARRGFATASGAARQGFETAAAAAQQGFAQVKAASARSAAAPKTGAEKSLLWVAIAAAILLLIPIQFTAITIVTALAGILLVVFLAMGRRIDSVELAAVMSLFALRFLILDVGRLTGSYHYAITFWLVLSRLGTYAFAVLCWLMALDRLPDRAKGEIALVFIGMFMVIYALAKLAGSIPGSSFRDLARSFGLYFGWAAFLAVYILGYYTSQRGAPARAQAAPQPQSTAQPQSAAWPRSAQPAPAAPAQSAWTQPAGQQTAAARSTIFCEMCGTELPGDAKFCDHCGARVMRTPARPEPETAKPAAPAAPEWASAPIFTAPSAPERVAAEPAPVQSAPVQSEAPAAPRVSSVRQAGFMALTDYVIDEKVSAFTFANAYKVYDMEGNLAGGIQQVNISGGAKAARVLLGSSMKNLQRFEYQILDASGAVLAAVKRGGMGDGIAAMRNVSIHDSRDQLIGSIQLVPKFTTTEMHVKDARGALVCVITGDWKGWNFTITDEGGRQLGTVTKKWNGLGRELFTSADKYLVSFTAALDGERKLLVTAAAITVDMVLHEYK